MANSKASWRNMLAGLQCVVGKRHGGCAGGINLHHVAEGSGLRSDWALVPLCEGHHTGGAGLHGMGSKSFLRLYRPPGDSEYGLLVWLLEDIAQRKVA
jgi:hypothetical protein